MKAVRLSPRTVVWILVAVLFVLHQDFWLWNDGTLVFGFIPVGLLYHAVFSIAAALTWAAAVKYAWPKEVERFAEEGAEEEAGGTPAEIPDAGKESEPPA